MKLKQRLHLELGPQSTENLGWLEEQLGTRTRVEVVRMALETLAFIVSRQSEGESLYMRRGNGEQVEIALPGLMRRTRFNTE